MGRSAQAGFRAFGGWAFVLCLAVTMVAACTNDFGQFNFEDPPETGGGGSGPGPGSGGTTSSAGGMGMGGMGMGGMGMGGMGGCTTVNDCPGMDSDCQMRTCINGMCGLNNDAPGTPCDDNGGTVCDGNGACVECLDGSDCPNSGVCLNNICQPGNCMDSLMNEDETDVDCGGSCPPCANALMCLVATDCQSGFCDATNVCAPCATEADCSGIADSYCDSGVCTPKKATGTTCGGADECLSGFCPGQDGVCCDTACDQQCEACLMTKTTAADGTCAPVSAATDPDNECTANPLGCEADNCSGNAGSCEPAMAGVVCRAAVDVCDAEEQCDGMMAACPADLKQPNTTVCNAAAGSCDVAEMCDGMNDACPADAVLPLNTTCRPAADVCDAIEVCDGMSPACPADSPLPMNVVCRAAAGACDVAEVCDGTAFTCPADAFIADDQPSTMDMCNPYLCDGMMASCPMSCMGSQDCVMGSSCVANVCQ